MSDSGQYLRIDLIRAYAAPGDGRYLRINLEPPPASGTLEPDAWSALATGAPTIFNWTQYAEPAGIDALQMGSASVYTPLSVSPTGWATLVAGTPTIARWEMPQPQGWDALLGLAGIAIAPWNGRPRPTPWSSTVWGTAFASHLHRTLDLATFGMRSDQHGTPTLSDSPRTIRQRVISTMQFGFPELGWTRTRDVQGFEATQFGTADAWDKRQPAYLAGFDAWQSGQANVQLYKRAVAPLSWYYQQDWLLHGNADVRNARQIIEQAFQVGPYDGGVFGDYHGVRNRNTAYDVQGFSALRMGRPDIELTADALVPAGGELGQWGPESFIAHSTRTMGAESWQSDRFGDYPSLRNAAASLPLPSVQPMAMGGASIRNRGTYYAMPSIGTTDQHAEPWVSRSPRGIDLAGRGMWAAQFGALITGYRVQTVQPGEIEPVAVFGSVWVVEQFTIARPLMPVAFDEVSPAARLRNVTPEVRPIPVPQDEWGAPAIRTQWRTVQATGSAHAQWPSERPFIEYRTKRVQVSGWDSFRTRDLHLVDLATPSPPPDVIVTGIRIGSTIGSTPALQATQFGGVTVREQQVELSGWDSLEWGTVRLRSNVLRPQQITPDAEQVGYPTIPGSRSIGAGAGEATQIGTALMSPWYIYAAGYPFGYSPADEPIDYRETRPQIGGPIWGGHAISLRVRYLQQQHGPDADAGTMTQMPDHEAQLRRRLLRVPTFAPGRIGFPELPERGNPEPEGFEATQFGTARLDEVPAYIRYLRPTGASQTERGPVEVQFRNRELSASGVDLAAWGSTSIAREFGPFPMVGWSATDWGDAMVDYRIRHREVQGWDSDEMEYTFGALRQRMRVAHQPRPVRGPRPGGIDASAFGAVATGIKSRTLQASQHYSWTPGYPSIAHLQTLVPSALDATQWGDPDRVVPGTVRPRSEPMTEAGRPMLARRFEAGAGAVLELGAPRPGWIAGASGWDALLYGETAAIGLNGHSCGRFPRAVRPGAWDSLAGGGHTVA